MSTVHCKKRYLIKNPKEVVAFLAMASSSIKKNITSLYVDHLSSYGVIAFHFSTYKESLACEAAMIEYIIQDVGNDKRYKRRYLELFGLPQNYDFDVDEVFSRLDKLEGHAFELSFHAGMSTQKVLKVLLYDTSIALEKASKKLLNDLPEARRELIHTVDILNEILHVGQNVFDSMTFKRLKERFEVLALIVDEEDIETLKALIVTQPYRLLLLDLSYIMFEESNFYTTKDMPILFFVRKHLKRYKYKLLKRVKKSLYM